MKTPTKKKAVNKKSVHYNDIKDDPKYDWNDPKVKKIILKWEAKNNKLSSISHTLYELYRTKSGAWKFRKRARNGEILNHSYNSKALAIKGMEADFRLTKEMSELKWKEVK